ncbi:hypothetical protein KY285_023864 [Solanum tuberosum]|nr:hypothetical protein KY289_024195 [Solanum tuberosum]KAH0676063.1 hypothetical protein KY285_023864 [Solanum tuberosum]
MTSVEELENQCLPISKFKKYATKWVIKVLVIRRSLTKEYKNANGEGIHSQLIFATKSYYIINGKLNGAKQYFLSMHNDLEVAFMNKTEVVEDKS